MLMSDVSTSEERAQLAARLAAARAARGRADARLTGAIDDFFIPRDSRLDDRLRSAVSRLLAGMVNAIETELRRHASRVLQGKGEGHRADSLLGGHAEVETRLSRAGLLRDRRLMDELIARARSDLMAQGLGATAMTGDRASLLVRLADDADGVVASAASALLVAETRRRSGNETGQPLGSDLPAEIHHQLVWWVAATIRESIVARSGDDPLVDRAIVEAAQRNLAAHDESARPEAVAARLAFALDPRPDELAPLLVEALGDRQLTLFVALLGRALDIDFDAVRAIVLEPEGDRLWLALRAASLDRPTIATVALALAEADPRRDLEAFADELDAIMAVPPEAARSALAPLTLHHDLRLAIDALAREARR